MNLRQLQSEVALWVHNNFPDQLPHQALLGIQEELGELSHAHLKMERNIRGNNTEHELAKMDAVADLIIFTINYCNHNGIDLENTLENTWKEVKKRDWKKFPKNGLSL